MSGPCLTRDESRDELNVLGGARSFWVAVQTLSAEGCCAEAQIELRHLSLGNHHVFLMFFGLVYAAVSSEEGWQGAPTYRIFINKLPAFIATLGSGF